MVRLRISFGNDMIGILKCSVVKCMYLVREYNV